MKGSQGSSAPDETAGAAAARAVKAITEKLTLTDRPAEISAPPAPRSNVALRASFIGVFGAPDTGKSTTIKKLLAQLAAPYLIVFDPGHEYDIAPHYIDELAFYGGINGGLKWATLRPSFALELRQRQFDRFCECALSIARERGSCMVIVDELHLVTDAGNAPAHWRELIETGRKFGISAICASIRPASIDKGFWTAATTIRTGRLNYAEDQKTLANVLNVQQSDVAALAGYDWIQRDMRDGAITRSPERAPA